MTGRVRQVNVSDGGVPKRAVDSADVGVNGLSGDRQANRKHHGGPMRAVCLFAWEVIERLRAEGHPIVPGSAGENLTLEGLAWDTLIPGSRLVFEGGLVLELTSFTEPCATIRDSFVNLEFRRIKQSLHPGESRVYAKVICAGRVRAGETVTVTAGANERHIICDEQRAGTSI